MQKLFISQPMVDRTNDEIKAERARILAKVKESLGEEDIELIDSFFEDAPHDAKPLWFLGKSFQLLSTANIVFFGGAWREYRGCTMENMAAHRYLEPTGVRIIEE